ncbi:MAG: sigma-70 family RNA polymerase sigma factor [Nitrospirae bacterium]|nr:sigma-70 family RNA polymerase sigma factor [Nitrospirota bacterium]
MATEDNPEIESDTGGVSKEEQAFLESLRAGDEAAFTRLVDQYYGVLLRLARTFVPSQAVAEEVVQETWMGVFEGLSRFEGRSSLKTWIFRILTNRAKTRGKRESRYEPIGTGGSQGEDQDLGSGDGFQDDGHWASLPRAWDENTPERLLLSKESRQQVDQAISTLTPMQQQVITLRDIDGLSSQEVCNVLDITETNQRVLLHRGRAKVRHSLDAYLQGESGNT